MNNQQKTALVTGASRGIGLAICKELITTGFSVLGVSRNIQPDQQLIDLAKKSEVTYDTLRADISKMSDHQRIFDVIQRKFGYLNVLINNAGVAPLIRKDVLEMEPESYHRVMNINLFGPAFLTQKIYPLIQQADSPAIVFITSVSAAAVSENRAEYCLSKAGLSMYASVLSKRLATEGINVFEIRPGIIDTDMISEVRDRYLKFADEGGIPKGRLGKPEDVSGVVCSLLTDKYRYATGLVIEISGGMQIRTL